eukprot:TRINITY_DN9446_c0_g2_i2.p1 TRINITY_DN9446_c0_g2~~TRINITY_DN9446_c0_g2_i2.p1  ORF type:complete len:405 (+),score=60.20 TRINITY_DN9446_c0_g2_i2:450-1664(+)
MEAKVAQLETEVAQLKAILDAFLLKPNSLSTIETEARKGIALEEGKERDQAVRAVMELCKEDIRAKTGVTIAGGSQGSSPSELSAPHSVYVSSEGYMYIADCQNDRVQLWKVGAAAGITVAGGNGKGDNNNQLNRPLNVFVSATNVFVADYYNHRIQLWGMGEKSGATIAGTKTQGPLPTQLSGPRGIFLTYNWFYVSDEGNHRVLQFPVPQAPPNKGNRGNAAITVAARGVFEEQGTPGVVVAGGNGAGNGGAQLNWPCGIFVTEDEGIYVADCENHRIQWWPAGASFGTTVAGGQGRGDKPQQLNRPHTVFVTKQKDIFVADTDNHRIQLWHSGADLGITVAGGNGHGPGNDQLECPRGIFLTAEGDLFVADSDNNRIQLWRTNPVLLLCQKLLAQQLDPPQ